MATKKTQKEAVTFDLFEDEPKKEMPKKTTTRKAPVKKEEPKVVEKVVEEKKKYSEDSMIPCKSVTSGKLILIGHSGDVYRWANQGIVEEVSYGDLKRLAQTADKNNHVFYPRFIIEDPEFVAQFPRLKEFYSSFDDKAVEDILSLPFDEMKVVIEKLPKGIQECIKGTAATMVDNGSLDSVKKVRLLDEVFGTKLSLMIVE